MQCIGLQLCWRYQAGTNPAVERNNGLYLFGSHKLHVTLALLLRPMAEAGQNEKVSLGETKVTKRR